MGGSALLSLFGAGFLLLKHLNSEKQPGDLRSFFFLLGLGLLRLLSISICFSKNDELIEILYSRLKYFESINYNCNKQI